MCDIQDFNSGGNDPGKKSWLNPVVGDLIADSITCNSFIGPAPVADRIQSLPTSVVCSNQVVMINGRDGSGNPALIASTSDGTTNPPGLNMWRPYIFGIFTGIPAVDRPYTMGGWSLGCSAVPYSMTQSGSAASNLQPSLAGSQIQSQYYRKISAEFLRPGTSLTFTMGGQFVYSSSNANGFCSGIQFGGNATTWCINTVRAVTGTTYWSSRYDATITSASLNAGVWSVSILVTGSYTSSEATVQADSVTRSRSQSINVTSVDASGLDWDLTAGYSAVGATGSVNITRNNHSAVISTCMYALVIP